MYTLNAHYPTMGDTELIVFEGRGDAARVATAHPEAFAISCDDCGTTMWCAATETFKAFVQDGHDGIHCPACLLKQVAGGVVISV